MLSHHLYPKCRISVQVRYPDRPPRKFNLTSYSSLSIPQAIAELPTILYRVHSGNPDAIRIAVTLRNLDGIIMAKLRYGIEVASMEGV